MSGILSKAVWSVLYFSPVRLDEILLKCLKNVTRNPEYIKKPGIDWKYLLNLLTFIYIYY